MDLLNKILHDQYIDIMLSEKQGEVYTEILELIEKKGLSIKQAQEVCIVCAQDIFARGINQSFLKNAPAK